MSEQEPAELAVEAGWKRDDLGFARRRRRGGIMRFNHGPSFSLIRPSLRQHHAFTKCKAIGQACLSQPESGRMENPGSNISRISGAHA
jgi:hypothetical protein